MLQLNEICVRNTLKGLNLSVAEGEFVFIIGANGAGKTTLFNIISGCEMPSSGSVVIKNKDITNLPQCEKSKWISTVLQDPKIGTVGEMTISENLALSYDRGRKRGVYIKDRKDLFKQKLSILGMGLENRLDEYVKNLSGGQRQALSLIMATIADYEILLLDEITSALDPIASDLVIETTRKIVSIEKKTCLFITHNMRHFDKFSGRVVEVTNGKAVTRKNGHFPF